MAPTNDSLLCYLLHALVHDGQLHISHTLTFFPLVIRITYSYHLPYTYTTLQVLASSISASFRFNGILSFAD